MTSSIYTNTGGRRRMDYSSLESGQQKEKNMEKSESDMTTEECQRHVFSKTVARLIERDGNRCFYCGAEFSVETPATIEHLLARKFGGNHHPANLCLACGPCNHRAGHFPIVEKLKLRNAA